MNKKPSNLAPIFIASTAIFFLGSAFKFIFGQKNEIESINSKKAPLANGTTTKESAPEEDDPVNSL